MDQRVSRLQFRHPLQTWSRKYIADTLSRFSVRDTKDLKAYSQLYCVDKVRAIFDGVVIQSCNGEILLPKVNMVYVSMDNQEN